MIYVLSTSHHLTCNAPWALWFAVPPAACTLQNERQLNKNLIQLIMSYARVYKEFWPLPWLMVPELITHTVAKICSLHKRLFSDICKSLHKK
jgi:hypothetical protein